MEKYERFEDATLEAAIDEPPTDWAAHEMQPTPLSEIPLQSNTDTEDQQDNGYCDTAVAIEYKGPDSKSDPKGILYEKNGVPQVIISDFKNIDQPSSCMSNTKKQVNSVIDHLGFCAFTLLMILLDVIIVIVDLATNDTDRGLEITSLVIMTYFLVEILVRMYAKGPRQFVKRWIEVLDSVIVVVSFVFAILPIAIGHLSSNITFVRFLVAGRFIRIILIVRLISERKHLTKATRRVVSQNKQRYQEDGFDLDLCYITDRVIAMSFPSTGLMSFYRNPIKDVAKFLDLKHKDHYRVYNLCSERMYDESLFHYQVQRVRIDDHNVPKLEDLLKFAVDARQWMTQDEDNVIAVHCKGGKGRTGTMICVWLVESGAFEEAKESLDYFGDRRTDLSVGQKFQGVETPSQSRYVGYFEIAKKQFGGRMPTARKLKLKSICVKNLEGVADGNGLDLSARVITETTVYEYDFAKQLNCKQQSSLAGTILLMTDDTPTLEGDTKVMFFSSCKTVPRGYDDCPFYFWFHTSFIEDNRLWLPREELDNPHKKKTWNTFHEGFGVQLEFEEL